MVSNERTPFLKELIRHSSKATLIMPSIVFNEEIDVNGTFQNTRDALNELKNDENLFIIEKEFNDDFTEITIQIRDLGDELSE